jgi:predicted lipoprotein with Yx(FWY)xxD motif
MDGITASGTRTWTASLIALVAAVALGLAACGGDDDGDDGSSASASGGGTASAGGISSESVDGTDALVDSDGQVLYTADQEKGGDVLCVRSCAATWKPVPASEGAGAASDLGLGEVDRPDGQKQLTYDGAPLYTFTDEGPGELTGDGLTDDFDGDQFTWHAATATAGADASTEDEDSSDSSDGGGGYSGY